MVLSTIERAVTLLQKGDVTKRIAVRAAWHLSELVGNSLSETHAERLRGYSRLGYFPNARAPKTLAEKLLWLKRHYRHELHVPLTDKLLVRDYVSAKAPALRIPKVLWSSTDAATIPFGHLPLPAVLKSNHASGHVVFLTADSDQVAVRQMADQWLKVRYDRTGAGRHYEGIVPRLFVEEFLGREHVELGLVRPDDVKLLVLNGVVRAILLHPVINGTRVRAVFDREWRRLPVGVLPFGKENARELKTVRSVSKPAALPIMLEAAERLGAPFPFVRVDLYNVDGEAYFSEMTFMPAGGFIKIFPYHWDRKLGECIDLSALESVNGSANRSSSASTTPST